MHEAVSNGKKVPTVTGKDVFPEYYMIYVEKFQDMINEDIDEWVYFFKHGEIRDDFKSPGILLAAKKLDYLIMSEQERKAYDDYLAYLGQELDILDTAREEGREEGRLQGRKEGRKEGIEEGIILARREDIFENLNEIGVVTKNIKKMINDETDINVLKKWLKVSMMVDSLEEFIRRTK